MSTTAKSIPQAAYATAGAGDQFAFDQINEPGAYVCNWSGHLLRIPEDGVKPGRSPVLGLVATEPAIVTRISSDPFVSVTKARMIASNLDLPVQF